MRRREAILAGFSASLFTPPRVAAAHGSQLELSVESYIFQQYAQRQHKPLGDVLSETIGMTRAAGFHNIELNSEFFTPELRDRTLGLVRENGLRMPSVYSGGALHERELAKATGERAL